MRRPPSGGPGQRATRALRRHIVMTIAVVLLLIGGTLFSQLLVAQAEAERAASDVTRRVASTVLEMLRATDFTHGVPEREEIDARLAAFFETGMIIRVKVWRVDGDTVEVVYSEDDRVEGDVRVFSRELADALDRGEILTFPVPDDAEHRYERDYDGDLREGFIGFRDATGAEMRLEVYVPVPTSEIMRNAVMVTIPTLSLGLLLLVAVLVPLSLTLGRRLRSVESERRRAVSYGLESRASERLELARRLHDEVVQDLSGARLRLEGELLEEEGASVDPAALETVIDILGQDIDVLRNILHEYAETEVDPASLSAKLRRLGDRSNERIATSVQVEEVPGIDQAAAVLVLRVADELLRNARSHSRSRRIGITWSRVSEDRAQLVVWDDGRGFDPSLEGAPGHVGLTLSRQAVLASGGRFELRSGDGNGTEVRVSLPIDSTG